MSKQDIDKYFQEMVPNLRRLIQGAAAKYKRYVEIDAALSEAYLHIFFKDNYLKLQTRKQLEAFLVNFLDKNIMWTNSKINKTESMANGFTRDNVYDPFTVDFSFDESDSESEIDIEPYYERRASKEFEACQETEGELDYKLHKEYWYNERKAILELYRIYLKTVAPEEDKINKPKDDETAKCRLNVFECYFDKGITKGVNMAKHLGTNKDYGARYVRMMKKDIQRFYKEWMENNN